MTKISKIWAREILDSRAEPTVETAILLDNGEMTVSSVPSGASTGSYEAIEMRDADPQRFHGRGVMKAVGAVNGKIAQAIVGMDPINQFEIDKKMIEADGTENKSQLGANAILSVSNCTAKAGALVSKIPLYRWINKLAKEVKVTTEDLTIPTPLFNMINGGLHGAGNLDFQEFHVIPSSIKTFSQGLRAGAEIYSSIGNNLEKRGAIHSVGDEGGYAPNLFANTDALEIIIESIKNTQYSLGRDILLGLDVAAHSFFNGSVYQIRDRTTSLDHNGLIDYFKQLNDQYHLAMLEDPLDEDAWEFWPKILALFEGQVTIVGDDLLATNPKRVDKAIEKKACNAILIKPNQIGTITETMGVIKKAREAGWKIVVSHRSGETNDYLIADFAVGVGADFVKFGAPARGERVAKYNRLLTIEGEISK